MNYHLLFMLCQSVETALKLNPNYLNFFPGGHWLNRLNFPAKSFMKIDGFSGFVDVSYMSIVHKYVRVLFSFK